MRIDSNSFAELNKRKNKSPRFVISIDFSGIGTDIVYFISHNDIPNVPATNYVNSIKDVSTSSQFIQPDKGLATIGNLRFDLLDKSGEITTLLKTKLQSLSGIRKKPAVVYFGYEGQDFTDFIRVQTQLVDKSVVFENGVYTFNCSDINRSLKDTIFDLRTSNLARSIDASTTSLFLYESDFEYCTHGTSYSDAPNQTVFYIQIEDEIFRVTNSVVDVTLGETLYKLTVVRGVLGTVPDEHIFNEATTDPDKRPVTTEVVYLEMPMPKLIYAIMSGTLYNQAGSSFPSNWTINLSGAFIRLADFLNIGNDWWNPLDDNVGKIVRFIGEKKVDAKSFIESQLALPYGAIMPIYGNGEMGLKKSTNVLEDAPSVITLNDKNIVKISGLTHDLSAVINDVLINWNYDILLEDFTRTHGLTDLTSRSIHGDTPTKTFNFRGIHGSRETYSTIKSMFDNHRDRWSSPPLRLSVNVMSSNNDLEVGDIVWVKYDNVRDFTNNTIITLDRAFEIQKISTNMISGSIKLDLFGSSGKAGLVKNLNDSPILPDSFYSSVGTDLGSLAETNVVGAVLHIIADLDLTGHADATNSTAVYYATQDLELDAGVTLTVNDNVQIRWKGHFAVNGVIDGDARGLVGGIGTTSLTPIPVTGGAYGQCESEGGLQEHNFTSNNRGRSQSVQGVQSIPAIAGNSVPYFDISYDSGSNTLLNLPTELRGVPASAGAGANAGAGFPDTGDDIALGGDGGTSGAGLLLIGRGMSFGASGSIHLNGSDGSVGQAIFRDDFFADNYGSAGSGAGACGGALVYFADGSGSITPNLFSKFSSVRGETPSALTLGGTQYTLAKPDYHYYPLVSGVGFQITRSFYTGHGVRLDNGKSMYRTQYIPEALVPTVDANVYAPRPANIVVTELLNTPRSAKGDLSTIQVVVTPPNSTAYNYANVFYRELGKKDWYEVGAADDTTTFVVPADGTIYEVFARTVSYSKKVGKGGVGTSITTTNVSVDQSDPTLAAKNVSGLQQQEIVGTNFTGKEVKLVWNVEGTNEGAFEDLNFSHYLVTVKEGATVLRTEKVNTNSYYYSHEKYNDDSATSRTLEFSVSRVNRNGNSSATPATLTLTNPAPTVPVVTLTPSIKSVNLAFTTPTDLDWKSTLVYMSTTSGFTPATGNLVFDSMSSNIDIIGLDVGTTYYFRVRLTDEFGDGNLTTEQSSIPTAVISADIDTTIPSLPTSLSLTSVVEDSKLYVKSEIKATWTASTDDGKLSGYIVEYWDSVNATKIQTFTTAIEHRITDAVVGRTYSVRVKAIDWASNESAFTATVTKTAIGDTTSISNITSLSAIAGLDKVSLSWINPTSVKHLTTQIHRGTVSTFTPSSANLIYDGLSDAFVDAKVVNGTTYYYKSATKTVSGVQSSFSSSVNASPFNISSANVANYMDALTVGNAYISNLDGGKITANTIDTNQLTAGAVTANEMTVAQLSAITADLGSITAGTVTGATLRTAASGARTQITTANGLEIINAGGTVIGNFDPLGLTVGNGATAMTVNSSGVVNVPSINANQGTIGGFDISATQVKNAAGTIQLNSSTNQISVGSATFEGAGVQMRYTGTAGEIYAGDGAENYQRFTASDGIRLGRDVQTHGIDSFYSRSVYDKYTFEGFKAYALRSTVIGGGGRGWSDASPTLGSYMGTYVIYTASDGTGGFRLEREGALSTVAGKFNTFRAIRTKIQLDDVNNGLMVFGTGGVAANQNFASFQILSGGGIRAIAKRLNGASNVSATFATAPSGSPVELMIEISPTFVKYYVNNVLRYTLSNTSYIPVSDSVTNDRRWMLEYNGTSGGFRKRLYVSNAEFMSQEI